MKGEMELARLRKMIDDQAEDDGLWFIAQTVTESYLQQELRSLHWAVESFVRASIAAKEG